MRSYGLMLIVLSSACGGQIPATAADRIGDIPITEQRAIDRGELGFRWPFTVGQGTLGCQSGAVVFRSAGVNYGVNDAAKARGYAAPDPIWRFRSEGPPTSPLGRIRQDERERIFRESSRCDEQPAAPGQAVENCRRNVREKYRLTDDELKQVEAEGRERLWPPLSPKHIDLAPLLEAGMKLCRP